MKTLLLVLGLFLAGCDNSALEAELAAVKSELVETQEALAAEREARERAEIERAEIIEYWTERELAGKRLGTLPVKGELEQHLDALIRAVQRCLIIPPLREALGERMRASLTALQKYRHALDRHDLIQTYQGLLTHSSKNMRRGADELEHALGEYGTGPGRTELEGLIRSTRDYARFIERITSK